MPEQTPDIHFIARSLMEGNSGSVVQRLADEACEVTLLGQTFDTDDILYLLGEVLPTEYQPVITKTFTSQKSNVRFFDLEVIRR